MPTHTKMKKTQLRQTVVMEDKNDKHEKLQKATDHCKAKNWCKANGWYTKVKKGKIQIMKNNDNVKNLNDNEK